MTPELVEQILDKVRLLFAAFGQLTQLKYPTHQLALMLRLAWVT
jgi:hypothetical protein